MSSREANANVLVAQGLAQEAEVLLLDEPINGLDIVSRSLILSAIEEEKALGENCGRYHPQP